MQDGRVRIREFIKKLIVSIKKEGSNTKNIIAAIGPCISKKITR